MANTKISALTSATTPLAGTEVLPIVQSSATVKVTTNDLTVRNIRANGTTGILQVTGPTAASTRVVTVPDANFTAARTDAAQSFTGDQTLSTGNLVIGTSGKGIDFTITSSGTGTMTSELLADYEEGTWTPVIADAGSGGNTGTCTVVNATYTKVGRQVTVQALITALNTTGMTAGNLICVRGLPFTASDYAQGNFYTYRVARNASTVSSSAGLAASTAVFFRLYTTSSATTDTYILVSNIVSGTSEIGFTVTYTV